MNSYGMVIQTLKQRNYCLYFAVFIFCLFVCFIFIVEKGQKQSFEILYDVFPLL